MLIPAFDIKVMIKLAHVTLRTLLHYYNHFYALVKLIKCRSLTIYRDLQKPNPVTSEGKFQDVTAEDVSDFIRKLRCDRLIAQSFTLSRKYVKYFTRRSSEWTLTSVGYILKPSAHDGMEIM